MIDRLSLRTALIATLLSVAGCASGPGGGIYVPIGSEPAKAPEPPRTSTDSEESEAPVWRKSEQPEVAPETREPARSSSPSYRETGDGLSPAVWRYMMQNLTVKSVIDLGCGKGVSTSGYAIH